MASAVADKVREKAFFVSGRHAWFRANTDVAATTAIRDAEELLGLIGDKMPQPNISAGTTSNPAHILTLSWLVGGYDTIRSISLSCKGHGQFDVLWEDPDGSTHRHKNLSLRAVLDLNIPEKMDSLTNRAAVNNSPAPP